MNISAPWAEHPAGSEEHGTEAHPAPYQGFMQTFPRRPDSSTRIPIAVLCPIPALSFLLIPAGPVFAIPTAAEGAAW